MKSSKQRTFFHLFYKMIFHKDIILFVTSNHQYCFPNFFHEFSAVGDESILLVGPKPRKTLFWTKLRKIYGKNWLCDVTIKILEEKKMLGNCRKLYFIFCIIIK